MKITLRKAVEVKLSEAKTTFPNIKFTGIWSNEAGEQSIEIKVYDVPSERVNEVETYLNNTGENVGYATYCESAESEEMKSKIHRICEERGYKKLELFTNKGKVVSYGMREYKEAREMIFEKMFHQVVTPVCNGVKHKECQTA
ncbi:hypothetical protein ACH6EH_06795 [Paenibacillus sp. JSM ZJ436]|uniref:hypothetical protein n=1 Tax=Paenibacillus sp. JSM ZJ436 TaxID=3376190 RepID=UPI0037AF8E74